MHIYPKYYVLGLVYSPPGCTSTSTQSCTTPSTVDYLAGSTMGTKVSMEHAFETSTDFKFDASFNLGDDMKSTVIGASASRVIQIPTVTRLRQRFQKRTRLKSRPPGTLTVWMTTRTSLFSC